MNQEQDPQDRTAAQLRALFDVALENEPASSVSALSVIQAAKRAQSTDFYQAEQSRHRRNSWLRGGLVAAVVVALGAILVPVLFRGSTASTASVSAASTSAAASSSDAAMSAPAAAAGSTTGTRRADSPDLASSAAASSAESSDSAAGSESAATGGASSAASSSAAASSAASGVSTGSTAADSSGGGGAAPHTPGQSGQAASETSASSEASSSGSEASGPTPTGAACQLPAAEVITAIQPVLPAGTSMVARPTPGSCVTFDAQSARRSVTFPALTADGAEITVRISHAAPGACRDSPGCLAIDGAPGAFAAVCTQQCSDVWLYGHGYEVFVASKITAASQAGLPIDQLLPIARAALAAVN